MAGDAANYFRALLGQGLGAQWGDEAEAWLRSKLPGSPGYEPELTKIQKEYGEFAQRNPVSSGVAEFVGGVLPMAASYALPGAQVAAPATTASTASTLARLAANPYVRGAVIGGITGGIAGAGGAKPGERGKGAAVGAAVGTAVGGGAPVVIRSGKAGYDWLRDRLLPTEETVMTRATGKINRAIEEAGTTPSAIEGRVAADKAKGIPSTMANADPALVDLAETVAQRSGPSARRVESTLEKQQKGSRKRVYEQVKNALQPKEYYDALESIKLDMSTKADPLYKQAFAFGEVSDPDVLDFLKLPQFKQGIKRAEKLLKAEGRGAELYKEVIDPTTGKATKEFVPTVETLHQVKRGLDDLIDKQTDPTTGKMTELGRVYVKKKNEFLNALDNAVPEYAQARAVYRGDAELMDAMRTGYKDFNSLDSELVVKLVNGMSQGEKEAFTTGVVRRLYGNMAKTPRNINAAENIVNSPETMDKLRPLFDSDSKFKLFAAALARESELVQNANKILRGAPTARRNQARERFEEGPAVGAVVADAVTGGFTNSLTNFAARVARSARMTDDVADKVAELLMSSEPKEVAAAVKVLDAYAKKGAVSAKNLSKAETGAIMGTAISSQPAPPGGEADLDYELNKEHFTKKYGAEQEGPDIEQDILNEEHSNVPGPKLKTK